MNDDRTLNELLDTWLDAGPAVAPARVADAARLEAGTTRQMNPLERWAYGRTAPMSTALRFSLAAAAVAVAAVVGFNLFIAPSVGTDAPPAPTASASPTWETFTSQRHGYSIQHPSDYRVTERGGAVRLEGMQIGSPGTDEIRSRESARLNLDDGTVVVSAHELEPGESLADFTERVSRTAACRNGGFALDATELDGEPAEQRIFECDVWDWLQVTAIHGDRGYVVWLVATAPPLAHDRPINEQFLESFRFTD